MRHYGGFTDLIDFTSDYLIALYFACRTDTGEDGRLIMIPEKPRKDLEPKESKEEYVTYTSKIEVSRLSKQSGVFVHALKGYVDLENNNGIKIITIEGKSKTDILEYLSKSHNISQKTLFDDLHGFIESQHNQLEAIKHLLSGIASVKERRYGRAIDDFSKAIELNPEYTQAYKAYNNRGSVYAIRGEHDRAIIDFNKAIELNPKHAKAYSNRGNAYRKKEKFDLAIADYSKAIELNPKYVPAYNNRGNTYHEQEKFDLAIDDYSKAIELDPEDAETYYGRGLAYATKGDYDKAIDDLDEAERLACEQNLTDLLNLIRTVRNQINNSRK